jgi:predicted RNase H-like HicB family nuclease
MKARNVRTQPHYQVVIEPTSTGFSAYVPDLPGCVATGQTFDQASRRIRSAIDLHLAGMRRDGEPIPAPRSRALQSA